MVKTFEGVLQRFFGRENGCDFLTKPIEKSRYFLDMIFSFNKAVL